MPKTLPREYRLVSGATLVICPRCKVPASPRQVGSDTLICNLCGNHSLESLWSLIHPSETRQITRGRVRHYRTGDATSHAPYSGVLHDPDTDEAFRPSDDIHAILSGLPEGTRVRVILTWEVPQVGEVDPGDYWTLLKPHTYGPAPRRGE